MRIGILGTGMVGTTIATRLVGLGHEVMIGARSRDNGKAAEWARQAGAGATHGNFADAATFGELVVMATLGSAVLDVARLAGSDALAGKTVLDVTNPLEFPKGGVPQLIPALCNITSIGEELQKALPRAHVVKALNTMTCTVMVDPSRVPGAHDVFLCGNDDGAKAAVVALLNQFGWPAPIDLGSIEAARGTEMMMPIWLSLWRHLGTADFNYRVVRAEVAP